MIFKIPLVTPIQDLTDQLDRLGFDCTPEIGAMFTDGIEYSISFEYVANTMHNFSNDDDIVDQLIDQVCMLLHQLFERIIQTFTMVVEPYWLCGRYYKEVKFDHGNQSIYLVVDGEL